MGKKTKGVGELGAGESVCGVLVGKIEDVVTCKTAVDVRIILKYI